MANKTNSVRLVDLVRYVRARVKSGIYKISLKDVKKNTEQKA